MCKNKKITCWPNNIWIWMQLTWQKTSGAHKRRWWLFPVQWNCGLNYSLFTCFSRAAPLVDCHFLLGIFFSGRAPPVCRKWPDLFFLPFPFLSFLAFNQLCLPLLSRLFSNGKCSNDRWLGTYICGLRRVSVWQVEQPPSLPPSRIVPVTCPYTQRNQQWNWYF